MPAPTLKDRITEDMKAAMRAREAERLGAIRMLLAAIKQKEVDERIVADDAQVAANDDKLIKQRRDSIAAFEQAGRTDLADKEKAEVAVLFAYLPAQATDEEVAAEVDAAIAATGAAG
ncbi:MAG: GatB/YqeY domain-containing protein, partial [Burkholderiales bacterium]|nr:GatB/YqeY domain-containing protein [Burkholderiales bacterium]